VSFVLTVFIQEFILMAAEDVASPDWANAADSVESTHGATAPPSDSAGRVFLAPNGVGISFSGPSGNLEYSISSHIQTFIDQYLVGRDLQVDDVAHLLLSYFRDLEPESKLVFHVAGYKGKSGDSTQQVWYVDMVKGVTKQLNTEGIHGVAWADAEALPVTHVTDNVCFSKVLAIKPGTAAWIAEQRTQM